MDFPLKYPVTFKGQQVDKLTLRRPKHRDLQNLETRKGGDIAKSTLMIADLAQVEPELISELDVEDSAAISAWIDSVFDPKGERSGTSGS